MKKNLLILFLSHISFLIHHFSYAQINNPDIKRTYHWYFGEKAGLDFSSGSPVAVTNSQMIVSGNPVSMSDTAGNLLFYSNRYNVWNRNHQIMPNGTGLIGNYGTNSFSHILGIPKPEDDNLYFLFYWQYDSTLVNLDLVYSIIDMSLNGGMGDVVSKQNFLMKNPLEAPSSVMHQNGKDIWIVTKKFNTNSFYSFLLTSNGLDTIPAISNAGTISTVLSNINFSHDGSKMAVAFGTNYEILDFDNSTGIVSNPIVFPPCNCSPYGVSFSPDGKIVYFSFLYYTVYSDSVVSANALHQYQINFSNSDSIINSKILLDSMSIVDSTGTVTNYVYDFIHGIQLAADGKIYTTHHSNPKMGAIITPNLSGINCNYVDSIIYLQGRNCRVGLPYYISSYFYDSLPAAITEIPGTENKIISYPNPFSKFITVVLPFTNNMTIEIFDIAGREHKIKTTTTYLNNSTALTIEKSELPAGIYLLNIIHNNQSYNQKLVIIN